MADPHTFLSRGGEMGALMRAHDWVGTAFGSLDHWPQSLRSVVSAVLNSPMLGAVLWGPELRMLYNDAYIPALEARHPAALGRPVAEVWGETWNQVAPPFHRALASGEGFSQTGVELTMIRRGKPESTHWNFTAAPIGGEDGQSIGLLYQGVEITEQVHAERQLKRTFERQRLLFEQMPGFVGVLSGPTHIYEYVNRAYVAMAGKRDFVGRSVREVFPELADQGFYELLDDVYASGESFSALAMPMRLSDEAADRHIDLLYQPIRDEGGRVTGIFVGGYDITERVRAQEHLRALTTTVEKQEYRPQGETVLVVDDEPTVRMLVTTVLEDCGYQSIEANDSIAGLKILESDARIDLLVTDVGLPGGMNGRQMADAGRVRRKGLKVLFITGYAENSVFGNGYLTPGMQVLTKPFTLDALGERIRTLIRG